MVNGSYKAELMIEFSVPELENMRNIEEIERYFVDGEMTKNIKEILKKEVDEFVTVTVNQTNARVWREQE